MAEKSFIENVNHLADLDHSLGMSLSISKNNIVFEAASVYDAVATFTVYNRTSGQEETHTSTSGALSAATFGAWIDSVDSTLSGLYPINMTSSFSIGSMNALLVNVTVSGSGYYLRSLDIEIKTGGVTKYDIKSTMSDPIEVLPYLADNLNPTALSSAITASVNIAPIMTVAADLALGLASNVKKAAALQTMTIDAVVTLAPEVVYDAPTNTLVFGIPAGATGATGPAGTAFQIETIYNSTAELLAGSVADGKFGLVAGTLSQADEDYGHLYLRKNNAWQFITDMSIQGAAGIQGPIGDTGPTGLTGPKGDTGFTGVGITSILRTTGTGAAGTTDVYTVTRTDATTATFSVYNGANGAQGIQGIQGIQGAVGLSILSGAVAPTAEGVNGDLYLNTVNGALYTKSAGLWTFSTNITGPQGIQGFQGAQGATGATGATGPVGATILYGTIAPTTQGVNGDMYINNTNSDLYAKEAEVWVLKSNLQGLIGLTGPTGAQGIQGIQGITGKSITSITKTAGIGAQGTTDTYTILMSDATTSTFLVYNGLDGNGSGDMLKVVYDSTANGIVDAAESVPWDGITGRPEVQPLSGDLTSIDAIVENAGYLKKTGVDTWVVDNTTFSPVTHNHENLYEPADATIVKTVSPGKLPILDGSLLTGVTATAIHAKSAYIGIYDYGTYDQTVYNF